MAYQRKGRAASFHEAAMRGDVAYQAGVAVEDTATPEKSDEKKVTSKLLRETPWGTVREGYFSITVKSDTEKDEKGDKKVLYTKDDEPFEYDVVSSLANIFVHQGAKLTDSQIDMIGKMVKDADDVENNKLLGEANLEILSTWNDKLKSNAKGKAYAAIFNRWKPVVGQQRDSAMASTINKVIKLMGVSAEAAIANLKKIGVVPEDYTLSDYMQTKQRSKKSDEDTEDE